MKVKIIEQDILTVDRGIICHQVNCQGRMGSGIALSIAQKWPKAEAEYKSMCDSAHPLNSNLGKYQLIEVQRASSGYFGPRQSSIFVCNIFGQDRYGRDKMHTDYDAVDAAFKKLAREHVRDKDDYLFFYSVHIPWNMGCNRGGGDWDKYRKIIESYIDDVIYCKLPGAK